jgi:hypothetical protein
VLYVHVSLNYFHELAKAGYISNRERVVLHDIEYDTYVFVLVENIRKKGDHPIEDIESILQQVHNPQGHCRPGVDILNGQLRGLQSGFVCSVCVCVCFFSSSHASTAGGQYQGGLHLHATNHVVSPVGIVARQDEAQHHEGAECQ